MRWSPVVEQLPLLSSHLQSSSLFQTDCSRYRLCFLKQRGSVVGDAQAATTYRPSGGQQDLKGAPLSEAKVELNTLNVWW